MGLLVLILKILKIRINL